MAVVPELRPRRAEAGRRSRARPARRGRGRDRGAAGRGDRRGRGSLFLATPNNPTGLEVASRRRDRARARPPRARPRRRRRGVLRLPRAGPSASIRSPTSPARATTAIALRTFSKLYGLAGLRVGYGVGPAAVVAAMRKVQRGYDVGALGAGGGAREPRRRGRGCATRREQNRVAMAALVEIAGRAAGSSRSPAARRTSSSSTSARMPTRLPRRCSEHGVAVQSGRRSGLPTSLRIGAGTPDELERLDAALGRTASGRVEQRR